MVWQTLAQITETGPKTRMMPRLFCRPCIERIVQLADPRYTPPAPLQLAVAERPELPSMADRISTLESLRASGGITEAEYARARALAERAWEDFLDSTEPFGVRHRFAAGPSTAYDLHKRWVRSGTFDALVRLLHADFTGMVSVSRTATPGSPYNLRDPSARCRRGGCDRARAPTARPSPTRAVPIPSSSPDCQKADWKRHRGDCRLRRRQINRRERLHAAKAGLCNLRGSGRAAPTGLGKVAPVALAAGRRRGPDTLSARVLTISMILTHSRGPPAFASSAPTGPVPTSSMDLPLTSLKASSRASCSLRDGSTSMYAFQ